MPIDQTIEVTSTAVDAAAQSVVGVTQVAADATQLAADVTQAAVDVAQSATADHVGSVLDTLVAVGQQLNPTQGTTLAIILAALVVVRMIWKKYQASKK